MEGLRLRFCEVDNGSEGRGDVLVVSMLATGVVKTRFGKRGKGGMGLYVHDAQWGAERGGRANLVSQAERRSQRNILASIPHALVCGRMRACSG